MLSIGWIHAAHVNIRFPVILPAPYHMQGHAELHMVPNASLGAQVIGIHCGGSNDNCLCLSMVTKKNKTMCVYT